MVSWTLLYCFLNIVPTNFCKIAKDYFHAKLGADQFSHDDSQMFHELDLFSSYRPLDTTKMIEISNRIHV